MKLCSKYSGDKFWQSILLQNNNPTPEGDIVTTDSLVMNFSAGATVHGTVVNLAGTMLSYGFVYADHDDPTIEDSIKEVGDTIFTGPYSGNINGLDFPSTMYFRAYLHTTDGITYGETLSGEVQICFAEGTLISMADGGKKRIEDITFEDELLVWNFDEGRLDTAKPIWMVRPFESHSYALLKFSDGTELETVDDGRGHRIYNMDCGMFTYSVLDTPLGTPTFTENQTTVALTDKKVIGRKSRFYNVVTERHFNVFANGILTSTGLNNLYPVNDMKFSKSFRHKASMEKYTGVPESLFNGLRLAEQPTLCVDKIKFMMERGIFR